MTGVPGTISLIARPNTACQLTVPLRVQVACRRTTTLVMLIAASAMMTSASSRRDQLGAQRRPV